MSEKAHAAQTELEASYETNRWPYVLTLPISWFLIIWVLSKKLLWKIFGKKPKINSFWFDGLGVQCRGIKEGAASWKALDIIYNHFSEVKKKDHQGFRGKVDDFWIGMINAQAVRNRFKLVRYELEKNLLNVSKKYSDEIRMLSLGCGSAHAILETMVALKKQGVIVHALLLDFDQTALDYAQEIAEQNGILDQVQVVLANVRDMLPIAEEYKPHVVEMLGLLDYIPEKPAIKLTAKIYKVLPRGGMFLTCNIHQNIEQFFLYVVINWGMIYRRRHELEKIIHNGGFDNYKIIYEPLNIHGIVIASK